MKTMPHLYRFAQILLVYTLLVILWGAWVRISHSGDGCGESWPLCHGQVIPDAKQGKTWVEYGHRLTSGLFGLVVIYLFVQGRKIAGTRAALRRALLATLIFMVTEALLGAKLVLFGLVGNNDSVLRLTAMGLHQINSLLLSGSVAMVCYYASSLPEKARLAQASAKLQVFPTRLQSLMGLFLLVAVTGAFASLSATLFPSTSVMEGLAKDFAPGAHYLLRLRISHPILATLIGGSAALYFWLRSQEEAPGLLRQSSQALAVIFLAGVFFGYLTLFSLAPVGMKIAHLLLAHVVWITLLYWFAIHHRQKELAP